MQSSVIREKSKKTIQKKYGVDHISKSTDIRDKVMKTNLSKYGAKNYILSDDFLKKSSNTLKNKWISDNIMKSDIFRKDRYDISSDENYLKYLNDKNSLLNCVSNNHTYIISSDNYYHRKQLNLPTCTICYPIGDKVSIREKEIFDFIKDIYGNEVDQSYRDGLEIDIYLPELKIGFEFNGLYWHSDEFKDKNYHLNKTKHFSERGIRIIHIWEDTWLSRQNIIKSQIRNLLNSTRNRVYARKCEIREIDNTTEFLNINHLQGVDRSVIKLGLFNNNVLLSVMTFNKMEGRTVMNLYEWNLSRFCNKIDTNVIGGASKLLKYFIRNYNPIRIISYADRDWSVGNLYETMKFYKLSESGPDYKYIVDGTRKHKQNYKKYNLGIKGKEITGRQFMKNKGYHRIWDCGKIKYELRL